MFIQSRLFHFHGRVTLLCANDVLRATGTIARKMLGSMIQDLFPVR